ncbi:MAG: heavy-metal-associated domain-containing protein [Clostridia bacterium]|nr:heavy-metal-associated domain-containing protein [Clostridia bacterium]
MTDYIIIILIIALVSVGAVYTFTHFRRKSGCCGSGGYRPRKKRLSSILYEKSFTVYGMHCKNCKMRVEEIVNDISGVCGTADLKNATLTVRYAKDVDDDLIISRIERAGYRVEKMQDTE